MISSNWPPRVMMLRSSSYNRVSATRSPSRWRASRWLRSSKNSPSWVVVLSTMSSA